MFNISELVLIILSPFSYGSYLITSEYLSGFILAMNLKVFLEEEISTGNLCQNSL